MLASLLPESGLHAWTMLKAIWEPYLWVFLASLLLTLILTPIVRALAMRWRVYDLPDERLKTHDRPIPYLGGVAVFLGWAIPVLFVAGYCTARPEANRMSPETGRVMRMATGEFSLSAGKELRQEMVLHEDDDAKLLAIEGPIDDPVLDQKRRDARQRRATMAALSKATTPDSQWIEHPGRIFWIVGAALLMLLIGLFDDLRDIPPKLKILGQVVAAIMLVAGGILFQGFPKQMPSDLGGVALLPSGVWWVIGLGIIFQVILVVGASNATNLLDGLDGLCSGVTSLICVGFLVLATSLMAWDIFRGNALPVHYEHAGIIVLLSFALMGAVLGFLPYNFNPASIFMGDAGSMFLGFMAATFMILFAERPEGFKWFLGAMVIFGLPIFDTGLALVRRLVNRQPIFAGDRSHFYDQLVDRGFSVQKSVSINYLLTMVFISAGVGIVFFRMRYAVLIYVLIFGAIAVAALKLGFVRGRADKP
jgi:UDP-N-acetylmuramyl pentapeptide phosphotransferase/UDP-N-acetylglucosamine-1-phosphate transferase